MLCIISTSGGVLSGSVPGPDGCPSDSYIALTVAEFDHFMVSPFKLDMQDAGLISGAVLLLWSVGFGFRTLIRALRDTDEGLSTNSD